MKKVVLLLLLALAACAPAPAETTATAAPTAVAIDNPVATPTPAAVGGQPSAVGSAVVFGRTAEGAFTHGAADAPVTLTDYSDFL